MSKLRGNIWLLATIVFAVALLTLLLSNIVTQPGHIIPELGGDAAKNIFTYVYHSTHGKGIWFDGMNYPYGEHIVYTDGQPVISVLLASIGGVTPEQALAVMWMLITFSYLLSIVYTYKTLLHYKMAPLFAMLFAGLIGIFTPQILRLESHYALSYTCIIPMLFYWNIRYHDHRHWRYCVYFLAIGCVFSFLHPYYVAMMLIWVMSYAAGYFIFTRGKWLQKAKHVLPLLSSVVLVLGIVAVVMKATDPVKDRPIAPLNTLYETCTRPKQVITSIISPAWQALNRTPVFSHVSTGGEGYGYIGIIAALTLVISFVAGIILSIRQRRINIIIGDIGFSPVWLFMAIATLVFSMGIPFVWHMDWLMEYMSFFKQFRSLGRFSWIFYHIITVYTALVLYTLYTRFSASRKYVVAYSVILLPMAFWAYEASGYIKYARFLSDKGVYNYTVIYPPAEQSWPVFLQQHQLSKDSFQALLLIPFFHVGTEKLWVGESNWLVSLGCRASLQLQLPIIDVMLSRSSWSQAKAQVKIEGGPYTEKAILQATGSNKPFLLLHFENDSLTPDQKYLLEASDYIGDFSQCHVYSCYPGRLAANDKRNADSIAAIVPHMQQQDTIINNTGTVFIDHFDYGTFGDHLFGAGAMLRINQDDSIIKIIPVTNAIDGQQYECSCWFKLATDDYKSPYIVLLMMDSTGNMVGFPDVVTRRSTDSYGMWFRAKGFFKMKSSCRSIQCKIMNAPRPTYLGMDELMLRPADALVISKAGGSLMVNNHPFKTKK